jgi:hypothetical protein
MAYLIRVFKVSGVMIALMLSSFSPLAFADIEQSAPVTGLGTTFETDSGLGLQNPDEIQDLDQNQNQNQNLSDDTQQLSKLLTDKITTTQAMHAGDEEVSEPVGDEF